MSGSLSNHSHRISILPAYNTRLFIASVHTCSILCIPFLTYELLGSVTVYTRFDGLDAHSLAHPTQRNNDVQRGKTCSEPRRPEASHNCANRPASSSCRHTRTASSRIAGLLLSPGGADTVRAQARPCDEDLAIRPTQTIPRRRPRKMDRSDLGLGLWLGRGGLGRSTPLFELQVFLLVDER
jgi:hypothetical protein